MPPSDTEKSGSTFPIIPFLVTIIVILSSVLTYFVFKPSATQKQVQNTQAISQQIVQQTTQKTWVKPISNSQGFAFIDQKNRKFYIYQFKNSQLSSVEEEPLWGSETAGTGTDSPLVSPDMLYTALIDKKTSQLWLMSNDTLLKKAITSDAISRITAWSPNSKKIIYYAGADTVEDRKNGELIDYSKPEIFSKHKLGGFYMFNIDTGETIGLYPLKAIEQFVDNDRLISFINWGDVQNPVKSIFFDTNTFTATYNDIKPSRSSIGQYTFRDNGKYWAFSYSKDPTNDMSIVYAPFPEEVGTTIDAGAWAEMQWPLFSPDGNSLIYIKRDGFFEPGYPKYVVHKYDLNTKSNTTYDEGFRTWWVDNNNIMVEGYEDALKNTVRYYTLNLQTKAVKKIFSQ